MFLEETSTLQLFCIRVPHQLPDKVLKTIQYAKYVLSSGKIHTKIHGGKGTFESSSPLPYKLDNNIYLPVSTTGNMQ